MNNSASETENDRQIRITGAQVVIKCLEQENVRHVFGIPGGANLPLYDALNASTIQHVLARHEQGAGFMAQGMARVTGKPEVCFASSGPGATNLITAVADAKMDSIPLVAITGQVSQHLIGTDAFQEVDTVALMSPITKFCCQARSAEELIKLIPKAFELARQGRPGPVAIDIPKDVQLQHLESVPQSLTTDAAALRTIPSQLIGQILERIERAQKPLVMAGAGVIKANAASALQKFVELRQIPVVHTLLGLGALPADHALSLGMLGMHAAKYTNQVLDECDLLIGLGVRFDDRATGLPSAFCPQADIIHVDIDAKEFGKIITPTLAVHADLGLLLQALLEREEKDRSLAKTLWNQRVEQLRRNTPELGSQEHSLFQPYTSIKAVAQAAPPSPLITSDVGQHQMWVAQAFPFSFAGQFLTSGGLGTMGFGLPAAIGAALAAPEKTVLCFSGDGSLMMNMQELATAAEQDLNVKLIVLNNGHLGMVRQQQNLFYQKNYTAIEFQQQTDFVLAARSMGVAGVSLDGCDDPLAALKSALHSRGPCVINIPISAEEMVFPMVPPGAANREMIEC